MPDISNSYLFKLEHRNSSDVLRNFSNSYFDIGEKAIYYFC